MQVCTSLQTDNHASTPPLCFLQAGCPSCRPTNSVSLSDYFDPSVSLNKSSRYLSLCGLMIGVMREHKKEHGKLMKDISKLEQQLRDSV